MTADRARVLIVDDSQTMRGVIAAMLSRDPDIEIVGQAGDAIEARAAIKALDPDVITLDVEMPNMNGLEFLERIMRLRPMPVVMVSTLTQKGADLALAALELGAVECVGKPMGGDTGYGFGELPNIVKAAARARVRPRGPSLSPGVPQSYQPSGRILAIGSSTGGVEALVELLGAFPENCPPTLIAQHMPASFTRSFAERLDRMCAPHVSEAEDGAPVEPGRIYIAPGATHHLELSGSTRRICRLSTAEPVNGHRPSVDVLFTSVAAIGPSAVGLILTGMGRDGARGLKAMRDAGASTFGQDEASCVVYGMPKAAFELGAVQVQLPLVKLSGAVLAACSAGKQENEECLQRQGSKF